MKAKDALMIDLFEEEFDNDNDDDELLQLGQDNTAIDPVSLEASDEDEEEAHSKGQSVPLVGPWLGVINVNEDENEDLARARLHATPQKLFVYMSQPSPSDCRWESRPSFSIPLPPLNPPSPHKSKHITESVDRCRPTATDDLDTPMLVASQASVNESPDPLVNMAQMMMNFMQRMQDNQEASNKRNLEIMEQHRLDIESRLE